MAMEKLRHVVPRWFCHWLDLPESWILVDRQLRQDKKKKKKAAMSKEDPNENGTNRAIPRPAGCCWIFLWSNAISQIFRDEGDHQRT